MRENAFRNVLLQLLGILIAGCCNPVVPLPDLTVTQVTAPVGLVYRTDPLNLGARVENTGTEAGPFVLEYWLSADAVLDGGDLLIASKLVPGLGAGEPFEDSIIGSSVEILGGKPGTNHIIVKVDAASQVPETSETNNTASAAIAVVYNRIIIDTYDPLEYNFDPGGYGALYSNVMELFGPSGDTSTPQYDDLWNPPGGLVSAVIASNTAGIGRPTENPYYDFAYIDYTADLPPGDYYLRVRMVNKIDASPYALRVLTEPDNFYSGWFFATTNASDSPDMPDTGGEGVPGSYQSLVLGGKLNRYLHAGEVHWVRLTLP